MGGFIRTAEFSLAVGAALAALNFGGDLMLLTAALLAGWVFTALGIFSSTNAKRGLLTALATLFFSTEGGLLYWHLHPDILARPYHSSAEKSIGKTYEEFKAVLGAPLNEPQNSAADLGSTDGAVQIFFQNGIQIYLKNPGITYVFPLNKPDTNVDKFPDPQYLIKWDKDEITAKKLCSVIPQLCKAAACRPPVGGGVDYYLKNPSKWSLIGCRQWGCVLDARNVYSQRFENGIMIGIVRADATTDLGSVFIEYQEDGRFKGEIRHVTDKATDCTRKFFEEAS
jgi:hypothetical protein